MTQGVSQTAQLRSGAEKNTGGPDGTWGAEAFGYCRRKTFEMLAIKSRWMTGTKWTVQTTRLGRGSVLLTAVPLASAFSSM